MKKISLIIIVCFTSLSIFAQWNDMGDSKTTGNLTVGSADTSQLIIRSSNRNPSYGEILFNSPDRNSKASIRGVNRGWGQTYLEFLTSPMVSGLSNPQVRMLIDQDGRVGIGTVTPNTQSLLHVNGVVRAKDFILEDKAYVGDWNMNGENSSTGNLTVGSSRTSSLTVKSERGGGGYGELRFSTDDYNSLAIVKGLNLGYGQTNLQFLTAPREAAPVVRMHIDQEGRVGIGTVTPNVQSLLHVNGVVRAKDIVLEDRAYVGDWNLNGENSSTGNLTVGSSRTSSLTVKSAKGGGGYGELRFSTDDYNSLAIVKGINLGYGQTSLQFLTAPREAAPVVRLHIDQYGKVGIGTEVPQTTLDVRGTIQANDIKVVVVQGADFVFNKDYKLRDLSEVEAFVKENNHLPEIQSEKDMQVNGVSMNELQIKLLQKVEELTLYVIQQNKRIEELEGALNKK